MVDIHAGDVLGYHGHGIFSSLIRLKTWAPAPGVSHVELVNSPLSAFASRDGKGVSIYALDRTERLVIVAETRDPRASGNSNGAAIEAALSQAVSDAIGVPPDVIELVPPDQPR